MIKYRQEHRWNVSNTIAYAIGAMQVEVLTGLKIVAKCINEDVDEDEQVKCRLGAFAAAGATTHDFTIGMTQWKR